VLFRHPRLLRNVAEQPSYLSMITPQSIVLVDRYRGSRHGIGLFSSLPIGRTRNNDCHDYGMRMHGTPYATEEPPHDSAFSRLQRRQASSEYARAESRRPSSSSASSCISAVATVLRTAWHLLPRRRAGRSAPDGRAGSRTWWLPRAAACSVLLPWRQGQGRPSV
jgi:hypothetical protein